MMRKIAFFGKMRAGKDTIAAAFANGALTDTCHLMAFADPLKDLVSIMQSHLDIDMVKDRELLQMLGAWGRRKDKLFWVNRSALLPTLDSAGDDENIIVITDGRHIAEMKELIRLGCFCVKVNRPEHLRRAAGADVTCSHESEREIEQIQDQWFDFIFDNSQDDMTPELSRLMMAFNKHYEE